MFPIQEIALGTCNEELAPICIFTAICLKKENMPIKIKTLVIYLMVISTTRQDQFHTLLFTILYLQNNHRTQNPLFMCENSYGYLLLMPVMFRPGNLSFHFTGSYNLICFIYCQYRQILDHICNHKPLNESQVTCN